jgi:signal transduction histidine kinase
MQPLQELNRYADSLMRQPLDHDLPQIAVQTKDEFGHLIAKINEVSAKMRSSLRQVLSFSSLASHELRTPLSIIRNQLENALHPKISEEVLRKTVTSVYDEILRLHRIVDDLLSLSTMQAGTFKLERRRIGFHAVLEEFYEEAAILAKESNIAVVLERGPEAFINADVVRIRQMFFNLLDNAIKHTPENGCIRLHYASKEDEVIFRFTDTGTGIPPHQLSKIFDAFYRATTDGSGSHGAGLGLALVKWIVDAHGGAITVQSELDKGTTFIIKFPVDKKAAAAAPQASGQNQALLEISNKH